MANQGRTAAAASAGGESPRLFDNSVPQEFLVACEAVASEVAARFFENSKVGATAQDGVVTVEVRAFEPNFQLFDLSSSVQFTADNTTEEMRNYWSAALPTLIQSCWGQIKVVTEAPRVAPPSDVEPA